MPSNLGNHPPFNPPPSPQHRRTSPHRSAPTSPHRATPFAAASLIRRRVQPAAVGRSCRDVPTRAPPQSVLSPPMTVSGTAGVAPASALHATSGAQELLSVAWHVQGAWKSFVKTRPKAWSMSLVRRLGRHDPLHAWQHALLQGCGGDCRQLLSLIHVFAGSASPLMCSWSMLRCSDIQTFP